MTLQSRVLRIDSEPPILASAQAQSQVVWVVTLSLMIGCLFLSLVPFVNALQPGWNGAYLPVFCALAALGGYFSRSTRAGGRSGRLRRIELVLVRSAFLLVGLQLYTALAATATERGFLLSHPRALWYEPLLVLAWLIGREVGADLSRLGEPPLHDMRYVAPEKRLASRVLTGGVALFAVSGLTHSSLGIFDHVPRASGSASLFAVLAYFVCAMVMLGRARYVAMHSRWTDRHMSIAPDLGKRWLLYSAAVLVVLVLSTLSLGSRSYGLQKVPQAIVTGVQAVFAPPPSTAHSASHHYPPPCKTVTALNQPCITVIQYYQPPYPFGGRCFNIPGGPPLCGALPGGQCGITGGVSTECHPFGGEVIILHTGELPGGPKQKGGWPFPSIPTLVKTGLLAAVFAVGVLYPLYAWRRRSFKGPAAARLSKLFPRAAKLAALLAALMRYWLRYLGKLMGRLRRSAVGKISTGDKRQDRGRAFRKLARRGRLGPREQALYYYLSVLKRAKRKGLSRKRSQTPIEFETEIAHRLPDVTDDVRILTQAFVEARYSRHSIDATRASFVRQSWMRVKMALAGRTG